MFATIYDRGKSLIEETLKLTWVRVGGKLHLLCQRHTKPLPLGGPIPINQVRRQNARQSWVRKKRSAEEISEAVEHLHRRLPANVLCEFIVQYPLDARRDLARCGMLLGPIP